MTTLDKIKAEIQKVLDVEGDSENARAQALALMWVLEIIDKYASEECDNDCEHCAYIECPKEPCDTISYNDDFATALEKISKYEDRKTCEDTVSIRKNALKTRIGNIVAYNVEWLREHWQQEMDIVCGIKPCDDAVSRQAVLYGVNDMFVQDWVRVLFETMVNELPSVQPKEEQLRKARKKAKRWKRKYLELREKCYPRERRFTMPTDVSLEQMNELVTIRRGADK